MGQSRAVSTPGGRSRDLDLESEIVGPFLVEHPDAIQFTAYAELENAEAGAGHLSDSKRTWPRMPRTQAASLRRHRVRPTFVTYDDRSRKCLAGTMQSLRRFPTAVVLATACVGRDRISSRGLYFAKTRPAASG